MQLLFVVRRIGILDRASNLLDSPLDCGLRTGALDKDGLILADGYSLGTAELFERDIGKLDSEVFGQELATGEQRDIFELSLAAIAESRCA